MSSRSTSLWVTHRMAPGPIWWILTLRARQPAVSSADRPREVGDRPAERHRGVEDTRAVEMHGDAVGARRRRDVGDLLRRAAGAAVAVVRILEADEAGGGDVDVAGPHVIADLGGGEEASLGGDRQGLHP